MSEKKQGLTEDQVKEMFALNTAEEVIDYGKKHGIEIPQEDAAKVVAALPDDLLEDVAGGTQKSNVSTLWINLPWNCLRCGEFHSSRFNGVMFCRDCHWVGTDLDFNTAC